MRCKNYQAYYVKMFCHFEKQSYGYCLIVKEIIMNKHHTCERWCSNFVRRQIRKDVSLNALNKALDNLVEIRQILVDEMNENKIYPLE